MFLKFPMSCKMQNVCASCSSKQGVRPSSTDPCWPFTYTTSVTFGPLLPDETGRTVSISLTWTAQFDLFTFLTPPCPHMTTVGVRRCPFITSLTEVGWLSWIVWCFLIVLWWLIFSSSINGDKRFRMICTLSKCLVLEIQLQCTLFVLEKLLQYKTFFLDLEGSGQERLDLRLCCNCLKANCSRTSCWLVTGEWSVWW